MASPLATLEDGNCKAEIYEESLPGQFAIRYFGKDGQVICEEALTGVSSYKQREQEIRARLSELCGGGKVSSAALADSGEY